MSDFQNYMLQQARRKEAYANYSHAGQALENARIHERLAEIKSQSEPLHSLINQTLTERDRIYAAAFYVVVGRLPENP
jgi:tRNA C32,U32 (ribose-2'-O)-methylase TrmJ